MVASFVETLNTLVCLANRRGLSPKASHGVKGMAELSWAQLHQMSDGERCEFYKLIGRNAPNGEMKIIRAISE